MELLKKLQGGLVVSCQARSESPLYGSAIMAAMAQAAALLGGAVGIRANGPADIAAIRSVVSLPIIGIYKQQLAGCDVYITPTLDSARQVVEAGADIVALDVTNRPPPWRVERGGIA